MTVVSADYYQHYIPLFLRCMRRWGDGIDTRIYVRGVMDSITNKALDCLFDSGICKTDYDHITTLTPDNYADSMSSTNTARFIHCDEDVVKYRHILIVDIDLMLFNNPFPWHMELMERSGQPFAGHHGPYHKPHRPEVCPAWQGPFERVSGGFFMVTPEWYWKTEDQRKWQLSDLQRGHTGWWRESDEVVLARIIKGSGMQVPNSKHFPLELRGCHLGDFKPSMEHRWTNLAKMVRKLSDDNGRSFVEIERCPVWQEMLEIMHEDVELMQILDNCRVHLSERGML